MSQSYIHLYTPQRGELRPSAGAELFYGCQRGEL